MPLTQHSSTILDHLLRITGGKHAFVVQRTETARRETRVVSSSTPEAGGMPDFSSLDLEEWNAVSRTGQFRCMSSDDLRRSTAVLRFDTPRHTDKTLVLVLGEAHAQASVIEPCMRLVSGHLSDVWKQTPASTQVVTRVAPASMAAGQALMAQRLDVVLAEARAQQKSTHVLLAIDLDGFTAISASYGSDAAAQLLESVGERLRECIRPGDVVARYGCDEFCILVQCTGEKPLTETVSAKLQEKLAAPFRVESHDIAVTASVGITRVLPEHESEADVRRDAYAAVHHAKVFGGNQCAVFDEDMHAKTKAKLRLEAELRHAIDRDEFCLHYQPIVNATTGKLSALEALLRWEHPVRGTLPPSEFLEALANAGLMTEVGRWIVSEACRQAVEWRAKAGFEAAISINVSPRQLLETAFVRDLSQQLDESGAEPSWIEIEITEDIALGDGEAALDMLYAIRERGVRVRIDDFGTGYSSLSYLQRLPVSGLKIDRAFIEQLEYDTHRQEIVGAIVRLAHVLGLDVVAEGIERPAQLSALVELGCDFVQGYHISRPQPAVAIAAWMDSREALA
jgi:diguanylate cyclase (GGDEF)-like protein